MGNNALLVNQGIGGSPQIAITTHGSDWYWAATAIMGLSTFIFLGLSLTKPRTDRIFHYITGAITMVATIAYFSMASNLGQTPIAVEFMRNEGIVAGKTREIFYVRYIDWVITTPLLLLDLLLTAGLPWPTIVFAILVDEVMIITGLVGALTRSRYKWGYYSFGCAALFYIAYVLIFQARMHARSLGTDIHKAFIICGVWTTFLWFLYPVAWGVSEGGNVIAPDSEAVFYGVLDVMAKPVFGALLLWGHRNIDPARLGLRINDYEHNPARYKKTDEKIGEAAAPADPSHTSNTAIENGDNLHSEMRDSSRTGNAADGVHDRNHTTV